MFQTSLLYLSKLQTTRRIICILHSFVVKIINSKLLAFSVFMVLVPETLGLDYGNDVKQVFGKTLYDARKLC